MIHHSVINICTRLAVTPQIEVEVTRVGIGAGHSGDMFGKPCQWSLS